MGEWDDAILIGVVARTHGNRGEVVVNPETDFPEERFYEGAQLMARANDGSPTTLEVVTMRMHQGRPVILFQGIASMNDAELLAGMELRVAEGAGDAVRLEPGEYYHRDLIGCDVVTESGEPIGQVTAVDDGHGQARLVVRSRRNEVLIPLADAICTVDLAARRITVRPPEGLLEVNGEWREPAAAERGQQSMMMIDVITIFPKMVDAGLTEGVVGRARTAGILDIVVHNLRDFTTDKHHVVDDVPFGGGPGMVMKPEPFFAALAAIRERRGQPDAVVLLTPAGERFTQAGARRLAAIDHVVFLCGRYEGIDERVRDALATEEISIGDYVLSGGEIPALAVIDAVARLVPGVVGDDQSVEADSFTRGLLDYPHYTRPAEFEGRKVPEVLLSGHHGEIRKWRRESALARTVERRPELLADAALDADEREWLKRSKS